MSKFKVGDKVVRIESNSGKVKVGCEYTVKEVWATSLSLCGEDFKYSQKYFELAAPKSIKESVSKRSQYTFDVPSRHKINISKIRSDLTTESPMAVVEWGKHFRIVIHSDFLNKLSYSKGSSGFLERYKDLKYGNITERSEIDPLRELVSEVMKAEWKGKKREVKVTICSI